MEIYYSPMAYYVCSRASIFISEMKKKRLIVNSIYLCYLFTGASGHEPNIFEYFWICGSRYFNKTFEFDPVFANEHQSNDVLYNVL